jgi:hypothetical protein
MEGTFFLFHSIPPPPFVQNDLFQISHCLSHHLFPNTIIDLEIIEMEPFAYFLPVPKSYFHRTFAVIYTNILFPLATLIEFTKRMYLIARRKVTPRPENALPLVQLALFMLLHGSVYDGLCSWLLLHLFCSWWFILIGLYAAHHLPGEIMRDSRIVRVDPPHLFSLSHFT